MKIALHALHFAEYAARLGLALADEGHSVLLMLGTDNSLAELSVPLQRRLSGGADGRLSCLVFDHVPFKDLRWMARTLEIRNALLAFGPDIIHAQETYSDPGFWSLWPGSGTPRISTVHDPVPHSGADSEMPWRKRQYRRLLRQQADALIVHGQAARTELEGVLSGKAQPIYVVPHGVLGVDEGPLPAMAVVAGRMLFFGRVETYKGLAVLLQASVLLRQRGVSHELHVAGRGSDLDRHRAELQAHPALLLDERYIPPAELPALFSRSAIVVLPYLDATQSGVVALAYAFGKPVVATRTGSLPEVVIEGYTGRLVPPGDPEALANVLQFLLEHPDELARLAQGAATFGEEQLAWPRIARITVECYHQVLGARSTVSLAREG